MSSRSFYVLSCLCLVVALLSATCTTARESKRQASEWQNQTDARLYNKPGSKLYNTDYIEEGFINMGSLHSFTSDLSGQHKSDVLMSTLYAQVKASALYGRNERSDLWYNEYISVLKSIGWEIDPFSFSKYSSSSSAYSIIEALKPILSAHCSDLQIKVAQEVLETYRALEDSDDKVFTFVANACHNESAMSGNFQILPATASSSGKVVTVFGAFFFKATVKVYRFLCYIMKETELFLSNAIQIGILDPNVYKKHRSYVLSQLGDKGEDSVKRINLPSKVK